MPKAPKQVDKNDPEYLEKRKRKNEAIKKCREKAKAKAEETQRKVETLKKDNKMLDDKIIVLGYQAAATSPPPADTETLPAFLEQGEVEVARSPPPPYPGYQPAATDLNTYTFTEAEAGSVAECEELALEQYSVTLELAPAATWAGPDLNTAEEFELSFLAPVHG